MPAVLERELELELELGLELVLGPGPGHVLEPVELALGPFAYIVAVATYVLGLPYYLACDFAY